MYATREEGEEAAGPWKYASDTPPLRIYIRNLLVTIYIMGLA